MEMFTKLIDHLTGHERVTLMETERMLVLENDALARSLAPGNTG